MATNAKKGKAGKDPERKGSRKSEESPITEEKKDETVGEGEETTPTEEHTTPVDEPPPKEPTPEPVYEEPVLVQLIVDSFEGGKAKGQYDGEGEACFVGGHYYVGEFSEGMMHGNGIYTWADGVCYEGEFTQNQVTGKGVYRWLDGSLYDGEVFNGQRHGFGTFRCANGKMSYMGGWSMGKRKGKGRMDYNENGTSFYDGDWVDNIKHGWGTRQYPSGNVYQGMWYNNMRHGEGTMRWLDRDQMYTGQWENGIQHGIGQHIWFLRRVAGSQYPMRNMYDGEFVRGLRHGWGVFYYANGARYEGQWESNMKHRKGKFIFKNGRVYEGTFDRDHIVEYPHFVMDGMNTPDLTQIRTRTPRTAELQSVHSNDSRNTYGPSFQLEIDQLLNELPEDDQQEETSQVMFVLMRYMSALHKIYNWYSCLGFEDSPDNTYILSRLQFWRMLKDCSVHHGHLTLTQCDRLLAGDKLEDCHNPYTKILFREFTNYLVILAYHLYSREHEGPELVLAWCLSKLITKNILKNACVVKGYVYYETRRAKNALFHMDQAHETFQEFQVQRKEPPLDKAMKMREFLFMMKDLKLINNDLTAKAVLDVLASDDPRVRDADGAINMELEMTFLEFFEALVGCAAVYVTETVVNDPSTPRPSTCITRDHSMLSVPGSPSRIASQAGGEEGQDEQGTPPPGSDIGTPLPRVGSNTTQKTMDESSKPDQKDSSISVGADNSGKDASQGTRHPSSAKKSEATLLGETKKSPSFMSTQSEVEGDIDGPMTHSMTSLGQRSDVPNDGFDEEEMLEEDEEEEDVHVEELDEATKQFNFWTHQVHIFFVRKFFPAAQRFTMIQHRLQTNVAKEAGTVSTPRTPAQMESSNTLGGGTTNTINETSMSNTPTVPVVVEIAATG